MLEPRVILGKSIEAALLSFKTASLADASTCLLKALGYTSEKTTDLGSDAETFLASIAAFKPDLGPISRDKVFADRWSSCAFLFQLTNDEIPSLAIGQSLLVADANVVRTQIESFVFLAIELVGDQWSRTALAGIARELNRRFPMPAILLIRHGDLFSFAVIDRRVSLRDAARDVVESKITVVKDVRLTSPHRAHIDILAGLALTSLGALKEDKRPSNFRQLYEAWIDALSIQALNKDFYTKLAWWYLWATKQVRFPQGGGPDREVVGVIRLITRLIFVWFIKERGLVPDALFDRDALKGLLKRAPDAHPDDCDYYHAILQNLFFATLNVEMGDDERGKPHRRWAQDNTSMKGDYLISLVYRHKEAFQDADAALAEHFSNVPFLNGGLFECLDEALTDEDIARNPELKKLAVKEGSGWVLRIDGFSRRLEARAHVPNKLFFGGADDAALNSEFETKGKRYPVTGLIDLLNGYKFTIDENTPLDEEVALDPELLGKVFENLLASYNPDTRSTARKQSGSFYTPRVVVDYMVDEALIAYFARSMQLMGANTGGVGTSGQRKINEVLDLGTGLGELDLSTATMQAVKPTPLSSPGTDWDGNITRRLRRLLSHADTDHDFSESEADKLVAAIENLKALDPACGSGAFPMGILAKLFVALKKLDPDNRRWRAQNLIPLQQRLSGARNTPDPVQRDAEVSDAEAALEKHNRDFCDPAYADYTRKLYLIEKCIFGSDIQPIAVQIAKLRFFIALIVSQPVDRAKTNWNITPLPNLETKIVAANTLFGVPRHGAQASLLDDPAIGEKEAELRDANAAYFTARTRGIKKRRKERVQKLHEELVALLRRDGFVTPRDAERMARWDPFDQNRYADFFDVEWMFGMPRAADRSEGVFDIVIGNPPYVRHEDIKELTPILKDVYHYECGSSRADLYVFFYERSVKLLKSGGVLSFITSNKWYRAKYGEALRHFMAGHTRLKSIIDFGDEAVFTALAYPTIVIATRRETPLSPAPAFENVRTLSWSQEHAVDSFPAVFEASGFDVPQVTLKKEGWQLVPQVKRQLLARIRSTGRPLGAVENGRLYSGIKTGLNEAFVIDGVTREKLIAEDPGSAELIKKYIRGRDVKRWRIEWAGLYLITFPFGFHAKLDGYPAILKHLTQYEDALRKRGQCTSSRSGKSEGQHHWLELDNNPKESYLAKFENPKIVVPDIALSPQFCWSEDGSVVDMTAFIIAGAEKWMLAVLNSSTWFWCFSQLSSQIQNGYFRFKAQYCEQVPIPDTDFRQKSILGALVNCIPATNDLRFEQLLNGLTFELFFSDELYAAEIRLFDACEKAGVSKLTALKDKALTTAANELAARIFANDHPIYAMLFDLQGLEVVRIIEGRE
jgi:hypothetical protein